LACYISKLKVIYQEEYRSSIWDTKQVKVEKIMKCTGSFYK
jgi:hypothetical protein